MTGYVQFRGHETCTCMAKWLPRYEAELIAAGEIKFSIDIYQLRGLAAASAETHSGGGAADIKQHSRKAALLARNMGAAAFIREYNWDSKGGVAHIHLVLVGCPHNAPARYQIAPLNGGYNGLGSGGYGGRDEGPRNGVHWPLRSWEQGIVWQQAQGRGRKDGRKARLRKALYRAARAAEANDRPTLRVWLREAAIVAPLLGKVLLTRRLWSLRKKWTTGKQIGKVSGNVAATLWEFRKKHTGAKSR